MAAPEIMRFAEAVLQHGVPDYLEISVADDKSFSITTVKDGRRQIYLVGAPGYRDVRVSEGKEINAEP